MEVSRLLKANNTLLKMGNHFQLPGLGWWSPISSPGTWTVSGSREWRSRSSSRWKSRGRSWRCTRTPWTCPLACWKCLEDTFHCPYYRVLVWSWGDSWRFSWIFTTNQVLLHQRRKTQNLAPQQHPPSSDKGNLLEEVHLKKTLKRRDPLLELYLRDERKEGRANVQLRSVPKQEAQQEKDLQMREPTWKIW